MSFDKTKYPNTNVGREQGGDRFFVKSGGYMNYNDQDFTGALLRLDFLSRTTRTNYVSSGSLLSVSVLTPAYGFAFFSTGAGVSKASVGLPSAEAGAALFLDFGGVQSNLSVLAGNASLTSPRGSDCSCILVTNGSVNSAWASLRCFTAGEWTIVGVSSRANVAAQASA